jgi:hypothetical protein
MSVATLLEKSAAFRKRQFAAPSISILVAGKQVDGYYSPVRNSRQLEDGGFKLYHASILRFPKSSAVTPALGDYVQIGAEQFRIDEIRDHPIAPEWVIGLNSAA